MNVFMTNAHHSHVSVILCLIGMPFSENKEVRQIARNMDLKHDIRQQEGQSYLIIHKRMTPQDMVQILKAKDNTSGKYSLLARDSLPSFSTIKPELEKQEAMRTTTVSTESAGKKKKNLDQAEQKC